jgi:cytochrome c553
MGRRCGYAGLAVIAVFLASGLAGLSFAQAPAPSNAPPAQAASGTAAAATQPADPHRGKELSYTCLGCHGIDGYRNAYPDYSVPKLEGQNPEYIVAALHGYRDGDRSHLTMHSQASELSDQDIADIALFFAGKPLAASGKAQGPVPKAAMLCVSCHGQDGVGVTPLYPSLAGQHADYLVRALEEYQNGGRKNPIMRSLAGPLTPALQTEPRPYTRFSAK